MEEVIAKATAKSVFDRFHNCEDFAYALDYHTFQEQEENDKISLYMDENPKDNFEISEQEEGVDDNDNNVNNRRNVNKEKEINTKHGTKIAEVYKASHKKINKDNNIETNPYKSLFISVGSIIFIVILASFLVGIKDDIVEITPNEKQVTQVTDSVFFNNVKTELINYFKKEDSDSGYYKQKFVYANMDKFVLVDSKGSVSDFDHIKFKKFLTNNKYRLINCSKDESQSAFKLEFVNEKPVLADLKGQVFNNKYNVYEVNFSSNIPGNNTPKEKRYNSKSKSVDSINNKANKIN